MWLRWFVVEGCGIIDRNGCANGGRQVEMVFAVCGA